MAATFNKEGYTLFDNKTYGTFLIAKTSCGVQYGQCPQVAPGLTLWRL